MKQLLGVQFQLSLAQPHPRGSMAEPSPQPVSPVGSGSAGARCAVLPATHMQLLSSQFPALRRTVVEASREEMATTYLSKRGALWEHLTEEETPGFAPVFDLPLQCL